MSDETTDVAAHTKPCSIVSLSSLLYSLLRKMNDFYTLLSVPELM